MIALLSNDLMFQSRIGSTVKNAGTTLVASRSAEQLIERIGTSDVPTLILIDLTLSSFDIAGGVAILKAKYPQADIVAYGPHVDVDRLEQAAASGARTLTRGQMDRDMASIIATAVAKS